MNEHSVWSFLIRFSIDVHMIVCSSCAHGIPCSSYGYAMLMLCSCYVYVAWIAWARVRLAPAGTPPTDIEQGKAYKWTRFPFTCQARFEQIGISLQRSSLFTSLFGFIFGSILGQLLDPILYQFWNHFGAIFGSILDIYFQYFLNAFYIHFGSIFGSILKVFRIHFGSMAPSEAMRW